MKYINNIFFVEKVSSNKLAKKFDTPIYCYSFEKLKKNINNFKSNFNKLNPLICFSIKSNFNLNIRVYGKKLPDEVYINYNNKDHRMIHEGDNYFSHNFKSVEDDITFNLFSEKVRSLIALSTFLPIIDLNIGLSFLTLDLTFLLIDLTIFSLFSFLFFFLLIAYFFSPDFEPSSALAFLSAGV